MSTTSTTSTASRIDDTLELGAPLVVVPPLETPEPPVPPTPPAPPAARPPRRRPRRRDRELPPNRELTGQILRLVALVFLALFCYVWLFGALQHGVAQDRLRREYADELSKGVAPVSEGTWVDNVLLTDGAPVAQLRIPQIGVDETVVEGTSASDLTLGPGHRRDTSLPGQVGVSVIMGRAAAFGGPFARLEELGPGDRFTVVTGQGENTFEVLGVRYAGDLSPATVGRGESRLTLITARGPAFVPQGVVRVDAELVSDPWPRGARQTTYASLPASQREMAGDTTRAWALVFALQVMLAAALGAVWTYRRIGARQAWIVFVPVGLLAFLVVADQAVRMLPNLM
jgi:LPXTG-site transpeptidase (sortase) family protein